MIGSLMYLTASRPDIMFAVCACSRFQVTPKTSHLHAVKRIFRFLKGKPKLGLWYLRVSSFDLEAYLDSDYAMQKARNLWLLLLQRDAYKKKLIQVLKIHTDDNVADLLTKAFDVSRSDEDFIAIGSAEDERIIKEMNEKRIDSSKDDSVKEKVKEEEG
ncbi:hypothetical protein Tco_0816879 [Tanacetum coccineum]